MKAKIKVTDYYDSGKKRFNVVEIFDRFVALDIDGRKSDFGFSEIEIVPDASWGQWILWGFRGRDESVLRDSDVSRIARRAATAWKQKISAIKRSMYAYLAW